MQSVLLQESTQHPSSTTACSSQAPSHSSPIEMDKCQLSQLIHQKDTLTLQELESLRKQIESQQQIQMTIKNNNPYKVHIQCKHFKSKKCTFQITFKAINAPAQLNMQYQSSSSTQQTNISSDSTPLSSLQTQLNNPPLSSSSNTSPSSPSKSGISLPVKDQMTMQANTQQTTSSSSLQEEGANAAAKQQPGDSCASVSLAQKASSAEINLSSQMLLQNKDAIKEEEDVPMQMQKREGKQEQEEEQQQQEMEDENNESFLNMIDEQHMSSHHYSLMSPISPFVFNIISSNHDINYLSLDGVQGESATQQQQQQPASNTADKSNTIAGTEDATTAIEEENTKVEEEDNDDNDDDDDENQHQQLLEAGFKIGNDVILFKLSNCRLQHRNHPVMSDEEYKIHLAKRWLEGHSEKIERIYEEIREKKGMSFKITPKIIKKCLLDTYDIDIYAKCTEKAHKKFLKKKLDNLMKAIRQKERSQQKSSAASTSAENKQKRSSSSSSSSQTCIQNKNNSTSNTVTPVQNITPSEFVSLVSHQEQQEIEECAQQNTIQNCQQQMQAEAPTSEIKIEEEMCQNSQNQQQQQQQLQVQQPKVYKEEWESFLELDVTYRLQPAH